jgi:PAS domain-containing protein
MAGRGGARAGAGRKPKNPGHPRVSISTRISDESSRQIKAYAEAAGLPVGQALDEIVAFSSMRPLFAELFSELRAHELPATTLNKVAAAAEAYERLTRHAVRSVGQLQKANVRIQAQAQRLDEQEAFLRGLIDHMPGSVAYLDRELILRFVNANWARQTAVDPEIHLDRPFSECYPASHLREDDLKKVLDTGDPVKLYGYAFMAPDGSLEYWDSVVAAVMDASGQIQGLLILSSDATDRMKLGAMKQGKPKREVQR